jgi:hypothetical protein
MMREITRETHGERIIPREKEGEKERMAIENERDGGRIIQRQKQRDKNRMKRQREREREK